MACGESAVWPGPPSSVAYVSSTYSSLTSGYRIIEEEIMADSVIETAAKKDWISGVEAGKVIGCSERQVPALAKNGLVTVKRLPVGKAHPRYLRSDCEKLAARIVKRATSN